MIKGVHCSEGNGELPFEECLKCTASHKNTCQFDYPILASMYRNLRKEVLQTRNDVYLDPKELYCAFRGQLFHAVIAQVHEKGAIIEQRFERTVAGITLFGHPDVIYPE